MDKIENCKAKIEEILKRNFNKNDLAFLCEGILKLVDLNKDKDI